MRGGASKQCNIRSDNLELECSGIVGFVAFADIIGGIGCDRHCVGALGDTGTDREDIAEVLRGIARQIFDNIVIDRIGIAVKINRSIGARPGLCRACIRNGIVQCELTAGLDGGGGDGDDGGVAEGEEDPELEFSLAAYDAKVGRGQGVFPGATARRCVLWAGPAGRGCLL